ncbi:MAG: hypothetical protein HOC74_00880, partial [Gemmatimonadetes bacterium]|nr:hypothetical protein [Gemmatimonadota bacterium]
YLAYLNRTLEKPEYARFIHLNADFLWTHARSADDEFDLRWTGPFERSSAQRQAAAQDLLNAAMLSTED